MSANGFWQQCQTPRSNQFPHIHELPARQPRRAVFIPSSGNRGSSGTIRDSHVSVRLDGGDSHTSRGSSVFPGRRVRTELFNAKIARFNRRAVCPAAKRDPSPRATDPTEAPQILSAPGDRHRFPTHSLPPLVRELTVISSEEPTEVESATLRFVIDRQGQTGAAGRPAHGRCAARGGMR